MNAQQKYEIWLSQVPSGTPIAKELADLAGNDQEIEARFANDLTFGTAGLRGVMGAGTDRMNIYTVRRAALAYEIDADAFLCGSVPWDRRWRCYDCQPQSCSI